MNKAALKNFATWARRALIEAVTLRAFAMGLTEKNVKDGSLLPSDKFLTPKGQLLSDTQRSQRDQLVGNIRTQGFEQVMEAAAYTWFNRLIALRYMEHKGLLPISQKLFPSAPGQTPEVLPQALRLSLPGLDREQLLLLVEANDSEGLYKLILLSLCNSLHPRLPQMFEPLGDDTELLFPDNLLREDSVLGALSALDAENWESVEVIGWLYQFYNTELKDETFAGLKKNIKITKERVGAATQLFTPRWIVRYMVENSLGKVISEQWVGGSGQQGAVGSNQVFSDQAEGETDVGEHQQREEERIERERAFAREMGWDYYLPEAPQTPAVRKQLNASLSTDPCLLAPAHYPLPTNHYPPPTTHSSLTTLKLLDPCMGSGHILVYAFELLMGAYRRQGYTDRDAVRSIVEHNLYGLDIDDRAAQLAYFAVMMKACDYDPRFLSREAVPQPKLCAIQESNALSPFTDFNWQLELGDLEVQTANQLISAFRDAKEYGSLLEPVVDHLDYVDSLIAQLRQARLDSLALPSWHHDVEHLLPQLAQQARILMDQYDVVVTNPPYMGSSGMNPRLSAFVKDQYPDSKSDLFATFMEKCESMLKDGGLQAMITMESWMFLSSFEKLREKLLSTQTIINMVHMPYLGKGGTSLGINFGTTAFIMSRDNLKGYSAQFCYIRYFETDDDGIPFVFPTKNERYQTSTIDNFTKIPGSPIAYWASESVFAAFTKGVSLGIVSEASEGVKTGNNDKFLRLWFEVSISKFAAWSGNPNFKWYPHHKGGDYRKWYGNHEYAVNWEYDGHEIKQSHNSGLQGIQMYFRKVICWSKITSKGTSFRYIPENCLFDSGSPALKPKCNLLYTLGLLNSVGASFLTLINPTINCQVGDVKALPQISDEENLHVAETLAQDSIITSKKDWDSFETSWDFKSHPMV